MDIMNVLDRILNLIEAKGLTHQFILKELDCGRSFFSDWKAGKIKNPPIDKIVRFAEYFDVSVDYLLGKTDDPNPPNKKNNAEDVPDIVTIQRFYNGASPKDREKFMQLLRITFDETFPKEEGSDGVQK